MAKKKEEARLKRKLSIRRKVHGTPERPRLTVFRSAKHIYAQVVDDVSRKTIAHVSTLSKEFKANPPTAAAPAGEAEGKGAEGAGDKTKAAKAGKKQLAARQIGKLIAAQCKAKNVTQVVFDRNGFIYHGRVAAVAAGAREGGLKF